MERKSAASRIASLSQDEKWRLRQMLKHRRQGGCALAAGALAACGIERITGVSGVPAYELLGEAARMGIRVLATRRQFSAAVLSGVDNFISGKLVNAVYLSAGPAITESITGVLMAKENNLPLLVIACRKLQSTPHSGDFQEFDALPVLQSITKWAVTVTRTGDISAILDRACRIAVSDVPGPVFVELPEDVLEGASILSQSEKTCAPEITEKKPDVELVARIGQLLECSQRPLLCLGEDLRWGYSREVLEAIVSKFQLPFMTTPMGRGLLPDDHPLCVNSVRRKAIHRADLFILAGAWFDWRLRKGLELGIACKVVHLHPDPAVLGLNVCATLAYCGQPMPILRTLAGRSIGKALCRDPWMGELGDMSKEQSAPLSPSWNCSPGYVPPEQLFRAIRKRLKRESVLIEDGSIHLSLSQHFLDSYEPFSRFDPGRNGCIGAGIPQALGVCLADPQRPVFAVVGDTGFGMSGMELETAVRHNLKFILLITNNSGISGELRQNATFGNHHPERVAQFQDKLPYHEVARALGVPSWELTSPDQLDGVLDAAFSTSGPACINALMDPSTPFPLIW